MVRTTLAVLVGLVLVVATAALGGYLLLGGDLGDGFASDRSADGNRGSGASAGQTTTPESPQSPAAPESAPSDADGAQGTSDGTGDDRPLPQLRRLVERDGPRARDRLAGSWVVQLSATPRNGQRSAVTDALATHRELEERGRLLLLNSTAWGAARPGHWVTVLARPYDTAADALGWCRGQELPSGDCFARELRADGTWDGNIDLWPPGAG